MTREQRPHRELVALRDLPDQRLIGKDPGGGFAAGGRGGGGQRLCEHWVLPSLEPERPCGVVHGRTLDPACFGAISRQAPICIVRIALPPGGDGGAERSRAPASSPGKPHQKPFFGNKRPWNRENGPRRRDTDDTKSAVREIPTIHGPVTDFGGWSFRT